MYKGLYYIYIVAKNTMDQKKKVIFQMVNHTLFLLFSIYLYKYVYEMVPSMQDKLPFPNAVWSIVVYAIFFCLGLRGIEKTMRADILSGNIEMYLLRPINYLWQKVFIQIGQGLVPFISATIISIILCYFLVGLPIVDIGFGFWILGLIVLFVLSQILTCLMYLLCGLSGLWLHNSEPVFFVVSKFIMIFGGAWVPVAFFPKLLQTFAIYSPFGPSVSISFAMYPNFVERFPQLFFISIIWILICVGLIIIISKRSFKKLAVNG